jgi:hypothetical protein
VVVNEPELAEAIDRLRGEWNERSGGTLSTATTTWDELSGNPSLDGDVIVFPSRYLGELCIRNWLRPMRPNVLEGKELALNDIFSLVRRELIRWGDEVMALPLGLDPLTIAPDPRQKPAMAFLVKAGFGTNPEADSSLFFDPKTMKPRITEPSFVAALERLPRRNDESVADSLDGATLPVLGHSDRLIAVTGSSRNAASAFNLVAWLAQAEISLQLARAGSQTLPVREATADSPSWYGSDVPAEKRNATARALERLLFAEQCLFVPRIPGVDEYMAALDQAVQSVVGSEATPEEALQNAAQRWEQITEARGRDAQRDAYLKHLGIEEP